MFHIRFRVTYLLYIFSQLKYIKNPIKNMQQVKVDALNLLSIEADVLCKANFENLIKDIAIKKAGEKLSNINKA